MMQELEKIELVFVLIFGLCTKQQFVTFPPIRQKVKDGTGYNSERTPRPM